MFDSGTASNGGARSPTPRRARVISVPPMVAPRERAALLFGFGTPIALVLDGMCFRVPRSRNREEAFLFGFECRGNRARRFLGGSRRIARSFKGEKSWRGNGAHEKRQLKRFSEPLPVHPADAMGVQTSDIPSRLLFFARTILLQMFQNHTPQPPPEAVFWRTQEGLGKPAHFIAHDRSSS